MGIKLSPQDEELYRRTDEVLHYIWDPIGVAGVPQARDEYHSYLPQVFALLKNGASKDAIASYLTQITTESIGLNPNPSRAAEVSSILVNWKEVLRGQ